MSFHVFPIHCYFGFFLPDLIITRSNVVSLEKPNNKDDGKVKNNPQRVELNAFRTWNGFSGKTGHGGMHFVRIRLGELVTKQ